MSGISIFLWPGSAAIASKSHAAVDRPGGQGVPQPMRVNARDAGGVSDAVDDSADRVPVDRTAMVDDEAAVRADVLEVRRGPVAEQCHQLRVQRDVAVVAQLAQRDA